MNKSLNGVLRHKPVDTSKFKNDTNRTVFKNVYGEIINDDIAVITHGDIFHADEVLAIAILGIVHCSEFLHIVRMHRSNLKLLEVHNPLTRKDVDELVNPYFTRSFTDKTFLVDCGKVFNNVWGFDHHQDKNLEAASSLVARKYFSSDFIEYHREFFDRISTIDCDKSKIEGAERTTEFNNLVRNLNAGGNVGFALAIDMATGILKGMIHEFIQYKITGDSYFDMIKAGNVRYNDEVIDTFKWQKYAEREGVKAIITRDRNDDNQIIVMSRDTKVFVIPEGYNTIFRHNSGFLATYATMEDAMNAVNGGKI